MLILWIVLGILILIGAFLLGGTTAFALYFKIYETDKKAYSVINATFEDMKKWIDEGNKLSKYPKERWEEFKYEWYNNR